MSLYIPWFGGQGWQLCASSHSIGIFQCQSPSSRRITWGITKCAKQLKRELGFVVQVTISFLSFQHFSGYYKVVERRQNLIDREIAGHKHSWVPINKTKQNGMLQLHGVIVGIFSLTIYLMMALNHQRIYNMSLAIAVASAWAYSFAPFESRHDAPVNQTPTVKDTITSAAIIADIVSTIDAIVTLLNVVCWLINIFSTKWLINTEIREFIYNKRFS